MYKYLITSSPKISAVGRKLSVPTKMCRQAARVSRSVSSDREKYPRYEYDYLTR